MARRKVSEIDASKSEFLTIRQFQIEIIPWSTDTIHEYVKTEGLPAHRTKSSGALTFNRREVQEWFKRRKIAG